MDIAEINFLTEFDLNRNGMISEIRTELDAVQVLFQQYALHGTEYRNMLDRMMVMPLRKLLCDEKSSVLIKVCTDFKMPPLHGKEIVISSDAFHMIIPDLIVLPEEKWLSLQDWREINIAWIDKDEQSMLPNVFDIAASDLQNKFVLEELCTRSEQLTILE